MSSLTTGQRLKSAVCSTEIMVIAAPEDELTLTCGGAEMSAEGGGGNGSVESGFDGGTTIGKRYVTADGKLELLCVKPGDGSLAIDGTLLKIKDAKKLPKTD